MFKGNTMNFHDALQLLNGKHSKTIAHCTYLETGWHTGTKPEHMHPENPDFIKLYYHNTAVVTYYPNGSTKITSGGYLTATTKKRINKYSDANIYQKNYVWYYPDGRKFRDGDTLTADGYILSIPDRY
jgi:hypothetical protein